MPLSIKNEATERLARQVAGETGESLTEAMQTSLRRTLGAAEAATCWLGRKRYSLLLAISK